MFDRPATDPLTGSVDWLTGTLVGDLAATICVIAVVFVGFSMLSGRLPIRRGMQVILGAFVLLGAPLIAAGMLGLLMPADGNRVPSADVVVYEAQPRGELRPSGNSPYLVPQPVPTATPAP